MTRSRIWLAAAGVVGLLGFAAPAEAQYYYYPHQQPGYYPQQPAYVPPRIARKQQQLEQRFIEKYGYVRPQPQYGYGYRQPRYQQPGYGYAQPGYGYGYGSQGYGRAYQEPNRRYGGPIPGGYVDSGQRAGGDR